MTEFRNNTKEIGGYKVDTMLDYSLVLDGLPKSNVLKFLLDIGAVVVCPSRTEPKLKTYITVSAKTKNDAQKIEQKILQDLQEKLN